MPKPTIMYTRKGIKSTGSNRSEGSTTFTEVETWIIPEKDAAGNPVTYARFVSDAPFPRKGQRHRNTMLFRVESTSDGGLCEIKDSEGVFMVEVIVNYRGIGNLEQTEEDKEKIENGQLMPWNLPMSSVKYNAVDVEEAMDKLYDKEGKPTPFRTSAGTEILASRNRPLLGMSFTYNLPEKAFKEEFIGKYRDTINQKYHTVAGRRYKPGTLKIVDIDATPQTEQLGEHGEGGDIKYWEISLSMVADPKTWWRDSVNASTFFKPTPESPFAQIWTTETVMKDKKETDKRPLFDYYGTSLKNYESEEITGEVTTSQRHYGTREMMTRFNQERTEEVSEPMFLFPEKCVYTVRESGEEYYFDQPTLYGIASKSKNPSPDEKPQPGPVILADGAILPFDRKTGRQYLGTYIHPDNPDIKIEYSERFGYWRPVVVEIDPETKEEYYALVRDPDKFPDLEERMVYSTTISGYQSPIVEFNELRIPKHQGYRWDDFSIPEEDEDQTVS